MREVWTEYKGSEYGKMVLQQFNVPSPLFNGKENWCGGGWWRFN